MAIRIDARLGIGVAAAALALSGCASLEDPNHRMAEGWRLGEVIEIGEAARMTGGATVDCRGLLPPEQLANRQFARMRYTYSRFSRTMVVPVSSSFPLKPGTFAWIKARDCSVSPEPSEGARWLWD